MRWKCEENPKPKAGDIEVVESFLWLPKTIDGETRWLEKARYAIRYEEAYDGYCHFLVVRDAWWINR